ncbi:unnamed protein product [Brassica rapa subsp. trilocularis]
MWPSSSLGDSDPCLVLSQKGISNCNQPKPKKILVATSLSLTPRAMAYAAR